MQNETLLELIWSGAIESRNANGDSPLAGLLDALLTVPAIGLVGDLGDGRAHAFMESTELMPGVSLGDVLDQEMGLDVPQDAVVLIEPACSADAEVYSGNHLGQVLGGILMQLAGAGASPLIRTEALQATAGEPMRGAMRPALRDSARLYAEPDRRGFQEGARA
ncbi:hypothetical protein [Pseudodonghicola flavimaris]|uniref:Uncharacterized protein n=1 Tax=Pseudodonghicola flavimaris TaxID=3050036 RepID=A0ABT7EWL9_9RHOB|nr:hypothetical protein [Pseudodonghicola flavimaris]MDK3016731.1 hypothetical protein [Pseudodonghicola flavimaris]